MGNLPGDPCLLHWQVDSYPLCQQGNPMRGFFPTICDVKARTNGTHVTCVTPALPPTLESPVTRSNSWWESEEYTWAESGKVGAVLSRPVESLIGHPFLCSARIPEPLPLSHVVPALECSRELMRHMLVGVRFLGGWSDHRLSAVLCGFFDGPFW